MHKAAAARIRLAGYRKIGAHRADQDWREHDRPQLQSKASRPTPRSRRRPAATLSIPQAGLVDSDDMRLSELSDRTHAVICLVVLPALSIAALVGVAFITRWLM
jgi:hypothetical protein